MSETAEQATTEAIEELKSSIKQQNEDRKREALMRKAQKAHDWRVQVWAQCERRIRGFNAQLAVLGAEEFIPYEPQFDDDEMLEHYSTMPLK